jgi:hypothetical protein
MSSYRRVVEPELVTSISSELPVWQFTTVGFIAFTALVFVSSVLPANTLNFNGTVLPPLMVFQTIGLPAGVISTGLVKPLFVHDLIVKLAELVVML